LAAQIGSLIEFVGNENAHLLLPSLETLCGVEQSRVREKSVDSFKKVALVMNPEQVNQHFFPLIQRLNATKWYTPHISLAPVIGMTYPHVSKEQRAELRGIYENLINGEAPLVRRSASASLGDLVAVIEDDLVESYVLPLFQKTIEDDQDHVRFMAVNSCIALCNKLTTRAKELILPAAKKLATDNAWRVRYMAADRFCDLSREFGESTVQAEMVDIFVELLEDREGEVRSAAASQITAFCQLLTEEIIIKTVLPAVQELANDDDEHVRSSLAGDVMGLAPLLGKTKTLEHLLDLFLRLLGDEFYEVRLSVISKLDGINQVVGIDLLSDSLLPAITQLAEESQWRVRLAIINEMPLLARQLGVQFFDEQLSNLCLKWLVDPVFSVREAASANFKELIDVFGVDWARTNIMPRVLDYCNHPHYLYRCTTLLCVNALAPAIGSEVIDSTLLPLVERMVTDNVPNIRMKVARSLALMAKHVESTIVEARILPALETLVSDSDKDVRYYANIAMKETKSS